MNTNINILKQDAPYLDSSRNKLLLIAFLVLFIFIFLIIYSPFNMNNWATDFYLGYIFIGGSVLLLTQFVLRPLFGLQKLKIYSLLLLWVFEMLLITFVIHLFYSPVSSTFLKKLNEYYITLEYVLLLMTGPYLLFVWYLSLKHKFSSFQKVEHNKLVANQDKNKDLLTITGENNKVHLAINYDQLLYVKSSGNYLDIYYLKGEIASKELVRVSLKELEAKITDSSIVRIHRSYMVNKHKISSFKKTRKGYKLIVQHSPDEILPVSLGYKDKFEEALELNVSH